MSLSRRSRVILTGVALVVLTIVGVETIDHYRSATARARRYFGMGFSEPVNPETVRRAFLDQMPIGTSEPEVRIYLDRVGVGSDGYSFSSNSRRAVVTIADQQFGPVLVFRHLTITLAFDERLRLGDVDVVDGLTGS